MGGVGCVFSQYALHRLSCSPGERPAREGGLCVCFICGFVCEHACGSALCSCSLMPRRSGDFEIVTQGQWNETVAVFIIHCAN